MAICYLDNSATTRVCEPAIAAAVSLMRDEFGNPSSLHTLGIRAERVMTGAREAVAGLLGCEPGEITFTSGGTEGNNLAILGGAAAYRRVGRHIVTTAVEHSSVLMACDELEQNGFEVTRVMPDKNGDISADAMLAACREDTVLVSMMMVNNETGARFPVEDMAAAVKQRFPRAHVHADAVQAAGKVPIKVGRTAVDLMTVSAHKLYGAKGCGALYIRRGVRLRPRQLGGEQEKRLRGGTEAMPLIGAFGAAIGALAPPAVQQAHMQALADRLIGQLREIDGVVLHLPVHRIPAIVNLSAIGIRSETMLHFLAERDVYVSSGSACAKGQPSHVLIAMGMPKREADSALRVSFGMDNTADDIDRFVAALTEGMRTLARAR